MPEAIAPPSVDHKDKSNNPIVKVYADRPDGSVGITKTMRLSEAIKRYAFASDVNDAYFWNTSEQIDYLNECDVTVEEVA